MWEKADLTKKASVNCSKIHQNGLIIILKNKSSVHIGKTIATKTTKMFLRKILFF